MKTNRTFKNSVIVATALLGLSSIGLTQVAQAHPGDWNRSPIAFQHNDYRPDDHHHHFDRWRHHDDGNKKLLTGLAVGAIAGVLLSH